MLLVNRIMGLIWRKLVLNPLAAGFLILALWDWLKLDFGMFRDLTNDPVTHFIPTLIMYGFAYLVAVGIGKLLTSTVFLTESDIKSEIEDLCASANTRLLVVSPYLDPGNILIESMIRARKRKIHVKLIHHSSQMNKVESREWLKRLLEAGVEIYHNPNLHAKLYATESAVIIASLNLVAGSMTNSFEAGVRSTAGELHDGVMKYVRETILKSDQTTMVTASDLPPDTGFCIRTRKTIGFNPKRPIEYSEYVKSGRTNEGQFCHSCGKDSSTSLNDPFCEECRIRCSSWAS